jgi:hypothetical protein
MLAVAIAFIVSRSLGYGIICASSCRDARRAFCLVLENLA